MSLGDGSPGELLAAGEAALNAGRWGAARTAFESSLAVDDTAAGRFGLAVALWWIGDNRGSVAHCAQAYSSFRRSGDIESAVRCAVWLCITYKANFANSSAASGWIGRAERLLEPSEVGPLHGWVWIARAYRMDELEVAEELTARALDVGRASGDVDLELVALAQLGLILVGKGDRNAGFALIDEATAAALAGEGTSLDTVVYACCDMLNACELANDLERAAQWCQVVDDFMESYGCPFLYAECRIYYGSVLAAKGRWTDAERELGEGLRITDGVCPGLHARALTRLASLHIRQGRLEEAEQLMTAPKPTPDRDAETALALAALHLARGDAANAGRLLERRLDLVAGRHTQLAAALGLLVDAHLATGDTASAAAAADRLAGITPADDRVTALTALACGRVAAATGDVPTAQAHLEHASIAWAELDLPYEVAMTRYELARLLADADPDVAVEQARAAFDDFRQLGASLDADRVAQLLRSLGAPARTGARADGALTPRELDVLRLLALGLTNPEIAERLYVSRKTAAHHVSSVLTKLDLRNRAEAAAYAVRVLGPEAAGRGHESDTR